MSPKQALVRSSAQTDTHISLRNDTASNNGCYSYLQNRIQTRPRSRKDERLDDLLSSERESIKARFWSKVNKTSGCWLWTASRTRGYGQFTIRFDAGVQEHYYAHRIAWWLEHGTTPLAGLNLCHTCDQPLCVRVNDHLFVGTQAENMADAGQKGRLVDGVRARKLSDAAYLDILTSTTTGVELARKYHTSEVSISRIRNGHQGSTFWLSKTSTLVPARFRRLQVRGEVA